MRDGLCGHHHAQCVCFFFFNDTATTEIYTLSLHDALPICPIAGQESPESQVYLAGVQIEKENICTPPKGSRPGPRKNSALPRRSWRFFCSYSHRYSYRSLHTHNIALPFKVSSLTRKGA